MAAQRDAGASTIGRMVALSEVVRESGCRFIIVSWFGLSRLLMRSAKGCSLATSGHRNPAARDSLGQVGVLPSNTVVMCPRVVVGVISNNRGSGDGVEPSCTVCEMLLAAHQLDELRDRAVERVAGLRRSGASTISRLSGRMSPLETLGENGTIAVLSQVKLTGPRTWPPAWWPRSRPEPRERSVDGQITLSNIPAMGRGVGVVQEVLTASAGRPRPRPASTSAGSTLHSPCSRARRVSGAASIPA